MTGRFLLAAFLPLLAGCSAAPTAPQARALPGIAPTLVLRGGGAFGDDAARAAMQQSDEQSWEYSRNDERLNVGWTPPVFAHQFATIRETDWLYTSNGRPLEFSKTYIQSVTERAAR